MSDMNRFAKEEIEWRRAEEMPGGVEHAHRNVPIPETAVRKSGQGFTIVSLPQRTGEEQISIITIDRRKSGEEAGKINSDPGWPPQQRPAVDGYCDAQGRKSNSIARSLQVFPEMPEFLK